MFYSLKSTIIPFDNLQIYTGRDAIATVREVTFSLPNRFCQTKVCRIECFFLLQYICRKQYALLYLLILINIIYY